MAKLTTYRIEVFIDERYLDQNEIANGGNKITTQAFGVRDKIDKTNNIVTCGIAHGRDHPVEILYPPHCIKRILITDMGKK